MSLLDAPSETSWRAYHRATRSATYGFLAALPLLLAYEVIIGVVNLTRPLAPVRLGAEVWLRWLLPAPLGVVVLLLALVVVGGVVFFVERKRRVPLRLRYFGLLIGESALYAFVVAAVVSSVVTVLFANVVAPTPPVAGPRAGGLLTQLALSIGAGVYEELVFRVLLVGGLSLLFRRLLGQPRRTAYVAAAVLGALLFSAAHYTGLYGDTLGAPSFLFRFLFGLALNALFLVRGFAVASWTHALYDVMIVTGLLG